MSFRVLQGIQATGDGQMKYVVVGVLWMVTVSLFVACGPYRGDYLTNSHPEIFRPCPSEDIEVPADHAFDAIIASLAYNDWVIEESSKKEKKLVARQCRTRAGAEGDYLNRPIKDCLVLRFIFRVNGALLVVNPDESRVYGSLMNRADDWLFALERTYAELRCYSADELRRLNAATKQDQE